MLDTQADACILTDMDTHTQLVLVLWISSICVLGTCAFVGWLAWHLFWDTYDSLMQERRRRKNKELNRRLNSPYFRSINSPYYRTRK